MIDGNIKIIGQPDVTDWFIALQVKCPCGKQFQLVGQVDGMRACGGQETNGEPCRRIYRISGLPVLQANSPNDVEPGRAPVVVSLDGTTFAAGIAFGTMPTT